jgi:hypothetical protein
VNYFKEKHVANVPEMLHALRFLSHKNEQWNT